MRPPRIVTVCARGRDNKSHEGEGPRLADLRAVARAVAARPDWHPVDAVLFPGGYLFTDTANAKALLEGRAPGSVIARAAEGFVGTLQDTSPDVQLVLGVDTSPYRAHGRLVGGQQLALAFNREGLSGFARKIFPIDEDVDGKTMPPFVTHERDFADPRRVVDLANGSRALLCVCYDMFGVAAAARNNPGKLHAVAMLETKEGELLDRRLAWPVLRDAFGAYREMLAGRNPDTALAAIHRFAAPGREGFWQRHGIASASAGLRGGFALAAAHVGTLSANPRMTRLMASGVPENHLDAASHRKAWVGDPQDYIVGNDDGGRTRWIARLYVP